MSPVDEVMHDGACMLVIVTLVLALLGWVDGDYNQMFRASVMGVTATLYWRTLRVEAA